MRPGRHNEWTRAKMVAFLKELGASQSVSGAARSVGMSRQAAYKLRNRMAGTPFALAWEVALEAGLQQLAHAVMDRAQPALSACLAGSRRGEEVPHYYHGEQVGTSRRYDNRLAAWMLDNPWKVGRQQIAREFSAEGWDRLLERIEWASLDWEAGEGPPGKDPPPVPSRWTRRTRRSRPRSTPMPMPRTARRCARSARCRTSRTASSPSAAGTPRWSRNRARRGAGAAGV